MAMHAVHVVCEGTRSMLLVAVANIWAQDLLSSIPGFRDHNFMMSEVYVDSWVTFGSVCKVRNHTHTS